MARPSQSWGHTIERVDPKQATAGRYSDGCSNRRRSCPGRHEGPAEWRPSGKTWIGGLVVFLASFQYVTGRQGRVTTRQRELCDPCGTLWAQKHGLALPAPDAPPATPLARDVLVSEFIGSFTTPGPGRE